MRRLAPNDLSFLSSAASLAISTLLHKVPPRSVKARITCQNMPYLHCIATKCAIPPSEEFPWFFASALPRSASALSRRSITDLFTRTDSALTRRQTCTNCGGSTGAYIAGIVIVVLALILSLWRAIWIRQQRQMVSDRARINMNHEYWQPAPMPPAAYGSNEVEGRVLAQARGTAAPLPQCHMQKGRFHSSARDTAVYPAQTVQPWPAS